MKGTTVEATAEKRYGSLAVQAITSVIRLKGHTTVRWLGERGALKCVKCQSTGEPYTIWLTGLIKRGNESTVLKEVPTLDELRDTTGFREI